MEVREAFGKALRLIRLKRGLTQEAFALVSSRTFVSMIERGETSPTIEKLDEICSVLGVNPATVVAISQLIKAEGLEESDALIGSIAAEISALLAKPTDTNDA
ncbi:TPA: helix-turn-helix transcriptional regulator [Pseudomonas aeruginosa]|nr:helix-turn-helix transcriptional regulator [Pseudomonas aeruginosa]